MTKFGALMKGKKFFVLIQKLMNRMLLSCTSFNGLVKVVCGKKLQNIAILNTKDPFFYKPVKPQVDRKTTSGFSLLRFSRYDRNTMSIRLVQTCKYNGKTLNWKLG